MLYSRSDNIIGAELDSEICIFDSISGEYLNLNSTASFIWKFLEEEKTDEQIINKVMQSFDLNEDNVRDEITDFLLEAVSFGILNSSND